jgi:hypothetical protein
MISASFLWLGGEDPNPPDENKWNMIRAHRNEILARGDWTQLGDAPLTAEQKEQWTRYRQALRDIPQDYEDPDDCMIPDLSDYEGGQP